MKRDDDPAGQPDDEAKRGSPAERKRKKKPDDSGDHALERLHQFRASRLPQEPDDEELPLCPVCGVRHRPEDAEALHGGREAGDHEEGEPAEPADNRTDAEQGGPAEPADNCSNDREEDR